MPTSASFFMVASGTKKIKKNCKKVLTFVSQGDIIIMGENNNNIKRSKGGSNDTRGCVVRNLKKLKKLFKKVLTLT